MKNTATTCKCDTESCPTEQDDASTTPSRLSGRSVALGVLALVAWVLLYRKLAPIAHWVTATLLHLPAGTHLSQAVEFFVFEVPKVLMLLTLVVFGVGIVRSFFTPERTRMILAGKRESVGNVLAALLGIVTPLVISFATLFMGETTNAESLLIVAIVCHTIGAFALKYSVLKVGIYRSVLPKAA